MPGKTQKQRIIEVRNGADGKGAATGNNAAWSCGCGYELPLVGTTLQAATPVVCTGYGKKYYLRPQEGNGSSVGHVEGG